MKTSARLQRPHAVLGAVHKAKGRPHVQANWQNTAGEREVQGQICLRCPVPTDKSPGVGRRHIHLQTQGLGAVVVWFTLTSLRSHSGVQQIREHQDSSLILFTKLHWWTGQVHPGEAEVGVALQHLTAQLHVHDLVGHCALFPSADKGLLLQGKNKKVAWFSVNFSCSLNISLNLHQVTLWVSLTRKRAVSQSSIMCHTDVINHSKQITSSNNHPVPVRANVTPVPAAPTWCRSQDLVRDGPCECDPNATSPNSERPMQEWFLS